MAEFFPIIYRFSKEIKDAYPAGSLQLGEVLCPSCGSVSRQKYILECSMTIFYFVIPVPHNREMLKTACSTCNTVFDLGRFARCEECNEYSSNACRYCTKCGHSK